MAQNGIQKYLTEADFFSSVRNPLETFYNNMNAMEKMSNFLNSASAADYPNIAVSDLTALSTLRTAINSFLASTDTETMLTETKKFIRI